jgi:predicted membrane-bound mannosyltransferase
MTTRPADAETQFRANPFERLQAARIAINWELAFYVAIFAAAFALRFWDLGARALHHDESIHAQWSWSLLQGNYHHSPIFHGPFYYHVQALVFLIFGASDYTARVSAAIFGCGIVALPLLLRRRLGPVGALAAVALLAFSPTIVYYSRFFREDIYLAFFTLLAVVAIWRYVDEGRTRWIFVFAAAFTGAVTTKEGAFLTIAVFLVYLDVWFASELARRSLAAREMPEAWRRIALTAGLSLFATPIAAFWPFLGGLRERMDWDEELPRSADMLVLLGTLTLPLLTPLSRVYLLEPLHLVAKDRLKWETNLQSNIANRDAVALAGLFAVTVSISAFVGLQWKAKVWAIAFLCSALVYLTLMTSFWTNWDGLVSGPWGSLDYWITQQDVSRGDQPWFYYYMVMPMYEFVPLALCIGGLWWSTIRGDAFSRFLFVWLAGSWLLLSLASEKMPWNNVHIALPACILAAYTVNRAWRAWNPHPHIPRVAALLISVAVVSLGALVAIAYLPTGPIYTVVRAVIFLAAVAIIAYAAWPFGRRAAPIVLVVAVVGAFSVFSVRTMVDASFTRGDVPKDMLIYTQTSPYLANVAHEIDQLAAASGKGYQMPIAVDSSDSFAWPWAWYLRDYKAVTYVDFTSGPPTGDFDVMLVNSTNLSKVNDQLAQQSSGKFASPIKYPHRWWFDETYKNAISTGKDASGVPLACTAKVGNCGPFNPDTWQQIAHGIFDKGWLSTWFYFWRDHDPDQLQNSTGDLRCNSCGSVDAYAFFPADYDVAAGTISVKPQEPPKPGVDKAGRPMFGGTGFQPGQFSSPSDVEIDAQGNIYVIDSVTKKLQKFDANGNFLAAVDIRDNPQDNAEASQPWGLGIASNGDIAVADTFGWRIKVFDKDLKPTGVEFGKPPDADKPPGDFTLFGPRDIAFDADGNMWVTDTGDARIQVYTARGQFVRSIGSRGAGPGQFDEPVGLSIASDGTVFVADMYNSRVEMLKPDGSFLGQFKVEGWGGRDVSDKPYLEALKDGRVAVGLPGKNTVAVYDRSGALQGTVTAPEDPLNRPYGIAETSDGKVWISEGGSGRLRLFTLP